MTAILTNKTWIKFVVVIFLFVIGIAGLFYAYNTYVELPVQEERIEEEIVPDGAEAVYQGKVIKGKFLRLS